MDEDTGPSLSSRPPLVGETGRTEVSVEAHRARALREGFLEVATVLASHNSVSAARGFATGTSARFPGASGPVWPEPPAPTAPLTSGGPGLNCAAWERPELRHWDSHHGAGHRLREELDTAWVSKVGVVAVLGQTDSAGAPPHPVISLPPSGPLPAASRLCTPAPLSGPAARPAPWPVRRRHHHRRREQCGPMSWAGEPAMQMPPACENSPPPPASTA